MNLNQQPTPKRDRGMEILLPVNRSGWAIAAGYVALVSFPFIFLGPVAMILGIVALIDTQKNPTRAGRGRIWFSILYGLFNTILLLLFVSLLLSNG